MEPRIQYAKTSDGVSIAFYTLGKGESLVSIPGIPFSHLQMEWKIPDVRRWYERLAEKKQLVRYDGRGNGLSERDVTDYSPDAQVRDLEAIVDHLALDRFSLLGGLFAGLVGVTYAARHPERVSHLILWCPFARGSSYLDAEPVQMLTALSDKDWSVYTETVAHARVGWSSGELAHQVATFFQESITPDALQSTYESLRQMDVTALLPQVVPPALVLHRRQVSVPNMTDVRVVASGIPSARLVVLEGDSPYVMVGDIESVAAAIDEFLSDGEEAAEDTAQSGLVTIVFTDIEGSTALTQKLGDARAQEVLRIHNAIVREALKGCGGSEIKHTGDGIMASFTSASSALQAAVAIQKALAEHNEGNPDAAIRVRIGLNAGEPVAEEDDLFGTAVQLAARVCDRAEAGQILASNVVQELAAGKGFTFIDKGEAMLKGFEKPVRLHEVTWHD